VTVYSLVGAAASLAAGIVITAGGLARQPLLWLAVPPLVLVRLAMSVLHGLRR